MFDDELSSPRSGLSTMSGRYKQPVMREVLDIEPRAISKQNIYTQPNSFGTLLPGQHSVDLSTPWEVKPAPHGIIRIVSAASKTLRTAWFWYSIASLVCWTAWAFTAKLGCKEIPPATMQFVSAFGFLLVGLLLFMFKNLQLRSSLRGGCYALVSGVLLGLGGIALYGAYRGSPSASVVTATTSLYPVVTVLFAVTFLREKLNKLQALGIFFAATAILLLSS